MFHPISLLFRPFSHFLRNPLRTIEDRAFQLQVKNMQWGGSCPLIMNNASNILFSHSLIFAFWEWEWRCIFCKRVRVGMNCSEMEECLCSLNRLFKHFTAVPTLANGSLPTHIHGWHWTFSKRGNSCFGTCCMVLGWAPEDSPFIWQESNLVVWAHLEFVSTDNLDISWPTNNHKRSFYIYWEWTSSHALLGFLLGGRNSRTTYPSPKLKALIFIQIERDLKIILFRGFFSGKQFTP